MLRWKTPKEIVGEKTNVLDAQAEDVPLPEPEDHEDDEEKKPDDITEAVKAALRASGLDKEAENVGKG
jgi:transcriptional regulator of met regulon